jgi:hypothetical protein
MLGSGSFTHGEIVTAMARVFCPATTPAVDSIFIERILIGFYRREDSPNTSTKAGGKISEEMG